MRSGLCEEAQLTPASRGPRGLPMVSSLGAAFPAAHAEAAVVGQLPGEGGPPATRPPPPGEGPEPAVVVLPPVGRPAGGAPRESGPGMSLRTVGANTKLMRMDGKGFGGKMFTWRKECCWDTDAQARLWDNRAGSLRSPVLIPLLLCFLLSVFSPL